MSHILEFQLPSPALAVAVLVVCLLQGIGSCQNVDFDDIINMSNVSGASISSDLVNTYYDDGDDLSGPLGPIDTLLSGDLEYVSSFDQHRAVAYGMGTMGLTSLLTTELTMNDDGALEKSRRTATYSFGSDLLNVEDVSSLTGIDSLGNQVTTSYQRTITFKDCELPFIMIGDDLTRLTAQGVDLDGTYSRTYLLLPDVYSADQINAFSDAFGETGNSQIKTFEFGSNMDEVFRDLGVDPAEYFGSFPWADAFSIFNNKAFWDWMLREMLNQSKQQQPQIKPNPLSDSWWEESGSVVSCKRHNVAL